MGSRNVRPSTWQSPSDPPRRQAGLRAWPLSLRARTLDGEPVSIDLRPDPRQGALPLVVAFLSGSDDRSAPFWSDLGSERSRLAARSDVVVVLDQPTTGVVDYPPCGNTAVVLAPQAAGQCGATSVPYFLIAGGGPDRRSWSGAADSVTDLCLKIAYVASGEVGHTPPAAARTAARRYAHSPHTAAIEVGGELLIYDRRGGTVHHLNAESSAIWNALDGTSSLAEIGERLSSSLRVERALIAADVEAATRTFLEADLIIAEDERNDARRRPDLWSQLVTPKYHAVPGDCCGRVNAQRLARTPSIVVQVANSRFALHCNEPRLMRMLRSIFSGSIVDDAIALLDYTIEMPVGRQNPPMPTLWHGATPLVASRSPFFLIEVLLGRLAAFLPIPVGYAALDADAWINCGEAVVRIPSQVGVSDPADLERGLEGLGLITARILLDLTTQQIVVYNNELGIDRHALESVSSRFGAHTTRESAPSGRYKVGSWLADKLIPRDPRGSISAPERMAYLSRFARVGPKTTPAIAAEGIFCAAASWPLDGWEITPPSTLAWR